MSFCAPPRAKSRQFHSPESSDPLNARSLRSLGFPKSPPLKNPRSANDWQHAQPQNLRVLGKENRIPVLLSYYWYCPRSMHVYVTVRCPSVCLSHSPAAAACCRFAAVGPAGRRYQSIAARPVPRKHGAAAANAGSVTFTADVRS